MPVPGDRSSIVLFVLPSTRIGGGTFETIRLASELRAEGVDSRVVSLWKHPNSVRATDLQGIHDVPMIYLSEIPPNKKRAPFDLLILSSRFRSLLSGLRGQSGNGRISIVLTHYSTLVLAWFVSAARRYCFVQEEEWKSLPPGLVRLFLRRFILSIYRRCRVITSNAYISECMSAAGVDPLAEARIWATPDFATPPACQERPFDLVVLLRYGYRKRLDLYLRLLAVARKEGLKSAVMTCEDDIAPQASELADLCLLRPAKETMKSVYQRSKVFVMLSELEGFGLPPLEAMGSGCVPLCRDSGGVRCYMTGSLAANLVPLEAPLGVVIERLRVLTADCRVLQQLSDEAREIFCRGAREAMAQRCAALRILQNPANQNSGVENVLA
jgi:glycosyltransferase involved in cell wall biosynthesis